MNAEHLKSVPSPVRMLSILDLFTDGRLHWTAEEISEQLQVPQTTGYRYVKMLVDAGLLQKASNFHYTIGARIMVLDHYKRVSDPLVNMGIPFMKELVAQTGLDCVVSGLYGGQVLDAHHEYGQSPEQLSYGRGRPRPWFRGAAPQTILACLPPQKKRLLFENHMNEIRQAGLPTEWDAFKRFLSVIKKQGHYFSFGEIDSKVAGVAAPIFQGENHVVGAISLVTSVQRMEFVDRTRLAQLLMNAAQDIGVRLSEKFFKESQ